MPSSEVSREQAHPLPPVRATNRSRFSPALAQEAPPPAGMPARGGRDVERGQRWNHRRVGTGRAVQSRSGAYRIAGPALRRGAVATWGGGAGERG